MECRKSLLLAVVLLVVTAALPGKSIGATTCSVTKEEQDALSVAAERIKAAKVLTGLEGWWEASDPDGFTRGQIAILFVRALNLSGDTENYSGQAPFPDLIRPDGTEHWAAPSVALLKNQGIIAGYPDGNFYPNEYVTLPQLKVMIARTLRLPGNPTLATVDALLLRSGLNPEVPCQSTGRASRTQTILLLDRALTTTFYARFNVDPGQ